jgi:hypothetical protein
MLVVKPPNRFAFVERALLRWRIRHELKRLKAEREKLQCAIADIEQMKLAVAGWAKRHE